MDYEQENENFVPLNWNSLMRNPNVLEEIKSHLDMLEAECLMAIISKAKEQGMRDSAIFLAFPKKEEYADLSSDAFEDSTED